MSERLEILAILKEKENLEKSLNELIYGSVEVRKKDSNKYIYVHYRENGLQLTKYIGEYSEELYNIILSNSIKAKEIKKKLRNVDKRLKNLGYIEEKLDKKVALNIDFAKSHMVDTIYKQAILEGVATTYADTETIIEGGKVSNMTPDDIMKVVNLKHAWEFILNKNVIMTPTNYSLLCEINRFIEEGFYYNAGQIRSTPVGIGGTKWKPEIPIESSIKEKLQNILDSDSDYLDKAVELLLFVKKTQIFIDGNKRTAVIFANHLLISHGLGIIAIPEDKVNKYRDLLIAYYENTDTKSIKSFLKTECYIKI